MEAIIQFQDLQEETLISREIERHKNNIKRCLLILSFIMILKANFKIPIKFSAPQDLGEFYLNVIFLVNFIAYVDSINDPNYATET